VRRRLGQLHSDLDRVLEHLPTADRRLDTVEEQLAAVDRRFDSVDEWVQSVVGQQQSIKDDVRKLDGSMGDLTARFDDVGSALRDLRRDVERIADERMLRVEKRLDEAERIGGEAESEAARLREDVIPAVVERGNLLIDRLAADLEEVASLVQRLVLSEPLPVPRSSREARLSETLAEIQPHVLEAFRGSETEIRHRLDRHLDAIRGAGPVLDLGCGRGELLSLLSEAGVEATGVESDAALADAARRRGLSVTEQDAIEALREQPEESLGAVAAVHFLEHFETADLLEILALVRRALRPGGMLLAECPNPHNIRVGASLYWRDPTHIRPLLPESLGLYLSASGFEVGEVEFLHPFPPEERLREDDSLSRDHLEAGDHPLDDRIDRLASRLDELLNGPRDFAIVARKPEA
jgi:SAM-dependent methyltransferase